MRVEREGRVRANKGMGIALVALGVRYNRVEQRRSKSGLKGVTICDTGRERQRHVATLTGYTY